MTDLVTSTPAALSPSASERQSEILRIMELAASRGWVIRGLKHDLKTDMIMFNYFGPDDPYSIKLMKAVAPAFFTAIFGIAFGEFSKKIPTPEFIKRAHEMLGAH